MKFVVSLSKSLMGWV